MGRYYSIELSGTPTSPASGPPLTLQWTSLPNGLPDPGALQVEFDFLTFQSMDFQGYSTVTIYGVSLSDLQQGTQFQGLDITIKAGMQTGLPLANPGLAGTILQGQIFQSFGNWVGTDMTLDFVINFSGFTYVQPGNIVLNWPKGVSLKSALATCLNVAFPTLGGPIMNIGDEYVLDFDVLHAVNTLKQLAQYVNSHTKAIQPPGVNITIQPDNTILVYDGSIPVGSPIQIQFTDLVGQPTWIDQETMQLTTVMRGDINVGTIVKMPIGLPSGPGTVVLTGSSLPSSLKYKTAFQGDFNVTAVRHVGNFRDPQGTSWVSIFRCTPLLSTATPVGPQE